MIPGSELKIVEGTGHLVHLERPEACAGWIADLIGRAHFAR